MDYGCKTPSRRLQFDLLLLLSLGACHPSQPFAEIPSALDDRSEFPGVPSWTPSVRPRLTKTDTSPGALLSGVSDYLRNGVRNLQALQRHVRITLNRTKVGVQDLMEHTAKLSDEVARAEESATSFATGAPRQILPTFGEELSRLNHEIGSLMNDRFEFSREFDVRPLPDTPAILRESVAQILNQVPLEEEFQAFSRSLEEQFATKAAAFRQFRISAIRLELEAAGMYPAPKSRNSKPFKQADMNQLIEDHVQVLGARKASSINYASVHCGARVLATSGNEAFQNDPGEILTELVLPGHAWSAQELPAFIEVEPCRPTVVSKISLEHILDYHYGPSFAGTAPASFEILCHVKNTSSRSPPKLLLKAVFDIRSQSVQFFEIPEKQRTGACASVELKLLSNHGSKCLTSVYKLGIYGDLETSGT